MAKKRKQFWYGGIFRNEEGEIYLVFAERRRKVKKYARKDTLLLIAKGENFLSVLGELKKLAQEKGVELPPSCC